MPIDIPIELKPVLSAFLKENKLFLASPGGKARMREVSGFGRTLRYPTDPGSFVGKGAALADATIGWVTRPPQRLLDHDRTPLVDVSDMTKKEAPLTMAAGLQVIALGAKALLVGVDQPFSLPRRFVKDFPLGMPRRYHVYPPEFQLLNVISTAGASLLAVGYLIPFTYLLWSLKYGAVVGPNPWGATGRAVLHASPGQLPPDLARRGWRAGVADSPLVDNRRLSDPRPAWVPTSVLRVGPAFFHRKAKISSGVAVNQASGKAALFQDGTLRTYSDHGSRITKLPVFVLILDRSATSPHHESVLFRNIPAQNWLSPSRTLFHVTAEFTEIYRRT